MSSLCRTGISGDIVGTVIDATGAVVAGLPLFLQVEESGSVQTVITGTTGRFDLPWNGGIVPKRGEPSPDAFRQKVTEADGTPRKCE